MKYAGLTTRDPGLLATGTILNGYARPDTDSPTQRGHLIRSRLLCQNISTAASRPEHDVHAVEHAGDHARSLHQRARARRRAPAVTS